MVVYCAKCGGVVLVSACTHRGEGVEICGGCEVLSLAVVVILSLLQVRRHAQHTARGSSSMEGERGKRERHAHI